MKVFVLTEEVDVVGVFKTYESALKCAKENNLFNFLIQQFEVAS